MATHPSTTTPRGAGATYLPKDERTLGFPAERTALLVIDPVNDFLAEGGAGWEMTKTVVSKHRVVDNLKRAIDAARRHGMPVLFAPMAYTQEDYADEALQRRSGINRLMFERRMFLAGTWGAQIHDELKPRGDEIVLEPHKSLDVFETDLKDHLERLGVTHLVIAGMTANLCCESTGRHAMEAGYDVTYVADAIGAATPEMYDAALRVNYPLIANAVIEVEDFEAALAPRETPGLEVREGDAVVGSDHETIGTVERVVMGTGLDHIVVKRGLVREKPAFVPLDAVTKRAGEELFLHVPKPLVDAMGWSEPPSLDAQREKLGAVSREDAGGPSGPGGPLGPGAGGVGPMGGP